MKVPKLPPAAVADAVVRHGLEVRLGPPGLRPLFEGRTIAGRALPVRHVGSVDGAGPLARSTTVSFGRVVAGLFGPVLGACRTLTKRVSGNEHRFPEFRQPTRTSERPRAH